MGGLCCRNKRNKNEELFSSTEILNEDLQNITVDQRGDPTSYTTLQTNFPREFNTSYDDFHSLLVHSISQSHAKTSNKNTEVENTKIHNETSNQEKPSINQKTTHSNLVEGKYSRKKARENERASSSTDNWYGDLKNTTSDRRNFPTVFNISQTNIQKQFDPIYDDIYSSVYSASTNHSKTSNEKAYNGNVSFIPRITGPNNENAKYTMKKVIQYNTAWSDNKENIPERTCVIENTKVWSSKVHQKTTDKGKLPLIDTVINLNLKYRSFDSNYFPNPQKVILFSTSPIYQVSPIHNKKEYWDIKKRITNKYIIVHSIEIIKNQLLETSYLLKKEQKLKCYPYLEELELFHGTKLEYADSICKNNFNWRFSGKEVGHIFGRGVCFSCNAMYAANYSDKDEYEKVMFIAKVIIGSKCVGKYNMKLPPAGCDTSTKQSDNIVVVKYEDNEFYPIYKITFHIAPGYVPFNKRDGNNTLTNK